MTGYAKISGTILKGDQCDNALITFIFLTEIKTPEYETED